MKNYEFFPNREIACHCGCGFDDVKDIFITMLIKAREMAGIPFVVNSMCRCEKHNADIGGREDSSHVKGYAADIECEDSRSRFIIIYCLLSAGFTRIGIGEDFVHVDFDPDKPGSVIWIY